MAYMPRRKAKELLDITDDQYSLLDHAAGGDPRRRLFLAYLAQEQDAQSRPWRQDDDRGFGRSWIEIPCQTLRGRFGDVDWRSLMPRDADRGSIGSIKGIGASEEPRPEPVYTPGVLRMREYSTADKQCRAFRLTAGFHERYIESGVTSVAEVKKASWVKPETRRKSGRAKRSKTHDGNGHPHPKRPLSALKVLRYGFFDAVALEAYLKRLKDAIKDLRGSHNRVARLEAERRYAADFYAYRGVLAQRPVEVGDGIYKYPLYYRVASSGRLYHVRGGLQ